MLVCEINSLVPKFNLFRTDDGRRETRCFCNDITHLFVRGLGQRPDKNKELPKHATYIQTRPAIEECYYHRIKIEQKIFKNRFILFCASIL